MLYYQLAIAPALICLIYIYIRDKYEKEPLRLLFLGVLYGVIISFPIISVENIVSIYAPLGGKYMDAFYSSFAVASAVEEIFKFGFLYFLVWRNPNFNERFDGIVYAAFISLGFAGFENVLYVINPELGGLQTALTRALISVPSHGLFGIIMGYYFALAKFENKKVFLIKALIYTWLIHGVFDFILLSDNQYYLVAFVPYLSFMWYTSIRKLKQHTQASPFR